MSVFLRVVLTLLALALCLWPAWLLIGFHGLVNPHGFFQEFFVVGVGLYFLWGAQVFFFLVWVAITAIIWLWE